MTYRAPAQTFEQLETWQKAHEFVLRVYRLSESFPKSELFGLSSQLRRAAVSVPANIAEGFKRRGKPDKAHFLNIAEASLEECRYYLILVRDLRYCDVTECMDCLQRVSRLLMSYADAVRADARR
jgi:four helix bundle protein